jgi:hypothetical protein
MTSEEMRREEKRRKHPNSPAIIQALVFESKSANPSPLLKQA